MYRQPECRRNFGLELVQSFVIPEVRRLLSTIDIDEATDSTDWFWQLVHPRISGLARPRFEAGFFGDAVEASYKEINDVVKQIVTDSNGQERDGANLMYAALSVENPVIQLTALETEQIETSNRAICISWQVQ